MTDYVLCERLVTDPAGDLRTDRFPTPDAAYIALLERMNRWPEVFGPTGTGRLVVRAGACAWCGVENCPDRWEHNRLHAASETTWRR